MVELKALACSHLVVVTCIVMALTVPSCGISPRHCLQRNVQGSVGFCNGPMCSARRVLNHGAASSASVRLRGGDGDESQPSSGSSMGHNHGMWRSLRKLDAKSQIHVLESLHSLLSQLTSVGRAPQLQAEAIATQTGNTDTIRAYLEAFGVVFSEGELVVGDEGLIEKAEADLEDRLHAARRAARASATSKRLASEPQSKVKKTGYHLILSS